MHDHEHAHDAHAPITERDDLTYYEKRVSAIQALLVEKGLVTADEVRRAVEDMDSRTPALGAKVVARAWVDPAFKARLLADAKAAIAELGIDIGSLNTLVAVDNTEQIHNVVVSRLWSCLSTSAPRGARERWYVLCSR